MEAGADSLPVLVPYPGTVSTSLPPLSPPSLVSVTSGRPLVANVTSPGNRESDDEEWEEVRAVVVVRMTGEGREKERETVFTI